HHTTRFPGPTADKEPRQEAPGSSTDLIRGPGDPNQPAGSRTKRREGHDMKGRGAKARPATTHPIAHALAKPLSDAGRPSYGVRAAARPALPPDRHRGLDVTP